jgi:hypothetical protein
MTVLLPEDGEGWLRLLRVAFRGMVENLLERADVETHLSRYNENRKSFMIVYLKNKDDDEDCREDIDVSATVEMEDAVTEMIDRDFKPREHSENMRDVAKHFRELAQRLDDAAEKHDQKPSAA